MAPQPRLSHQGLKLLRLLLRAPKTPMSGAEITREIKVGSGTLYPLLSRLEAASWLSSEWEDVSPTEAGRPRRRLYRLTGEGERAAREALQEISGPEGALQWAR